MLLVRNVCHSSAFVRQTISPCRAGSKFFFASSSLVVYEAMNSFFAKPIYSRAAYCLTMVMAILVTFSYRKPVLTRRVQTPKSTSLSAEFSTYVLNRDQTEEWKGWLQFAFIIYHYMLVSENLIYFPIRVCVATYV